MSSNLTEFFKKKHEEVEKNKVDWEKTKDEWLKNLSELYEQIISWVSEAEKKGFIKTSKEIIEMSEMDLGRYKAPILLIETGGEQIEFKPIGKLVLGADGRVDICSYIETHTLLYKKNEGWFLFEQTKKQSLKPFTEKLFAELLEGMF